jgi:hypothetical protein
VVAETRSQLPHHATGRPPAGELEAARNHGPRDDHGRQAEQRDTESRERVTRDSAGDHACKERGLRDEQHARGDTEHDRDGEWDACGAALAQ